MSQGFEHKFEGQHLRFLAATEVELQNEVEKAADEWAEESAKRIEEQHQRLLMIVNLSSASASDKKYIERGLAAVAKQTRSALLRTAVVSQSLRGRFFCFPDPN